MTAAQLSVAFFLQMFVILAAARVVGSLARRIGQPQVVGEMIAGVLLGPSLFGYFTPELQAQLFPKESMKVLYVGAQLGVGLYMFLVGVDFKTELFRSRAKSAAAVSISGMIVPFGLGALLAVWLVGVPNLFSPKATTLEAMLFLGAAMAITAFPMLARIIYERGLTGTEGLVLAMVCKGLRPTEIAISHGVQVCTVRSQLRSIRQKTASDSVRELVEKVSVLPPMARHLQHLQSLPAALLHGNQQGVPLAA